MEWMRTIPYLNCFKGIIMTVFFFIIYRIIKDSFPENGLMGESEHSHSSLLPWENQKMDFSCRR
ncbi:unnamed protein product [Trifolium pratense]|uniref:Uncharacterized protein n=1 Tax=Trifolium pratense TaxID=57577 RepID=A0ACB0LJP0_TRIPR|nr:unnamed protein product [Trifolium pratense]